MGFFNFIKKAAGKVFKPIKEKVDKVLKPIIGGARKVAGTIAKPLDFINEGAKRLLSKLDLPIIGNPLEKLKSVPVIGRGIRALSGVSNGIDALEAFGKGNDRQALEEMKDVAKDLGPKPARRVLKMVDKIRSII